MRTKTLFSTLLLSAFLSPASALIVAAAKDDDDKKVDRFGQVQIKPGLAFAGSAAVVSAATAVQVMTPKWVQNTLGAACEGGIGKWCLDCITALDDMKRSNPLGLTLGHGIITKTCADVLAQTIPNSDQAAVWLDPLRVFRSMLASVLSTSMPFYFWTRFMARSKTIGPAPGFVKALLGKGFGTALWKTIVTQLLFRPFNVGLFLALQSIFRGDSARTLTKFLSSKIKSSIVGGVAFYSVSNLIMYSIPVPFLHPIMGSVAGLIFNVWLAIVAYSKTK
jgi:hypothetical protein